MMYQKLKKEKLKEKKKAKKENEDKPKQVPKTIENCRVIDETFIKDIQNDPELQLDLNTDEISKHFARNSKKSKSIEKKSKEDDDLDEEDEDKKYAFTTETNDEEEFKENEKSESNENEIQVDEDEDSDSDDSSDEEENTDPKILITTNDLRISFKTYKLCRELSRILPNANYFYRKNVRISKVIPEAIKRDYSALVVINENRKEPNGMMITLLPEGPTMNFKLSNVKLSDEIKHGGGFTKHKPEIILNNFNTRLGLQIGRSFAALFPHDPQYEGRHCITFHNQRDYIFFRHHRYIFKSAQKVGLQELGPRFTLKLRTLQKGVFNPKFGEYEYVHKRHAMESNRRKFQI